MTTSPSDPLPRIAHALEEAVRVLKRYTPGAVDADDQGGGDPVTEADRATDTLLRELLPEGDEGWLSEETVDDPIRLHKERVWIVDPLDGTREFVAGIPEWCVSVALVEEGRAARGLHGVISIGSHRNRIDLDPKSVRELGRFNRV